MRATAQSLGLNMFYNRVLTYWFGSILRASWRTPHTADGFAFFRDYAICPKWASSANGGLSCMVKARGLWADCVQYERWEITGHVTSTKIDSHRSRYFPLGLPTLGARDHVVRRVNSVLRFTRSSKLSNRNSRFSKRFIRGIRLQKLLRKTRAPDYINWRHGVPREHRSKVDRLGRAACQKPTMPSHGPRPHP